MRKQTRVPEDSRRMFACMYGKVDPLYEGTNSRRDRASVNTGSDFHLRGFIAVHKVASGSNATLTISRRSERARPVPCPIWIAWQWLHKEIVEETSFSSLSNPIVRRT